MNPFKNPYLLGNPSITVSSLREDASSFKIFITTLTSLVCFLLQEGHLH